MVSELSKLLGDDVNWRERLLFSEHHFSHAASAFYPSPFQSAAVLTLDGVGEWTTTSLAVGNGKDLKVIKEIHFPHSLGLLYSAFTYYTGFKVNSGEYKVMGLAPYGTPKYADVKLARGIAAETGERNLCLAGGVALNCVANGILLREKIFEKVWIQPAAGDAGGALGAALSVWYAHHDNERTVDSNNDAMNGSYLGPEFSNSEIEMALEECGAKYHKLSEIDLVDQVASALSEKLLAGCKDAWNLVPAL